MFDDPQLTETEHDPFILYLYRCRHLAECRGSLAELMQALHGAKFNSSPSLGTEP